MNQDLSAFDPASLHVPFSRNELERSIPEAFEDRVRANPEKLAVWSPTEQLTYFELNQAANRVTQTILARRQLFGQPIAFPAEAGVAPLAVILGILKSGNIYTPLDTALPNSRLRQVLVDSGAPLIVTAGLHRDRVQSLVEDANQIVDLGGTDQELRWDDPAISVRPDQPCSLLYTSSSSGPPKGVLQSHRNILHCVMRYTNGCRLSSVDRFSLLASPAFAASVPDLFCSLLSGATLFCYSIRKGSLDDLARWMTQKEVTIYHSVPSLFRRVARGLSGRGLFPTLRLIILGGEPILNTDIDLFQRHFSSGCRLCVGLGTTETHIVRRLFVEHDTTIEDACVPVGYAVDDMDVQVVDEQGSAVPPNQPGEIVVTSRYLALGYWNQPELTRTAFRADLEDDSRRTYRTGDLGVLRADGCLVHLGRRDSQVKIRGVRVEVAEIEAALLALDQFVEAVVVPVRNSLEPTLVAYLMPETGAKCPAEPRKLREHLAQTLPEAMIPKAFILCSELPRTSTGKVDRRALRERPVEWTARTQVDLPEGAQTATEAVLIDLFAQVLGQEKASPGDTFGELGGTSLQAMELVRAIETILAKIVPWSMLSGTATIRDLARKINAVATGPRVIALSAHRRQTCHPSFFCVPGLLYGAELLRPLAEGLCPERVCYGLEYGIEPKIVPLAATLVQEMKRIQPRGPYQLGGHSFGGWIAYEAARQLHAAKEQVGLLLLFDTYGPGFPRLVEPSMHLRALGWRQRLKRLLLRCTPRDRKEASSPRFADAWTFISQGLRQECQEYLARSDPYPDPVFLLRASIQAQSPWLSASDPFNGLAAYVPGGLHVSTIPGDHTSILQAPELALTIATLMQPLAY